MSVAMKLTPKFAVCHNKRGVSHFVQLTPGLVTETGQPFTEVYEDEDTALKRHEYLQTLTPDSDPRSVLPAGKYQPGYWRRLWRAIRGKEN